MQINCNIVYKWYVASIFVSYHSVFYWKTQMIWLQTFKQNLFPIKWVIAVKSQVSIIFSHIITRISYFRWDDDDMRYVLDQYI
jgi:hypothetical protein